MPSRLQSFFLPHEQWAPCHRAQKACRLLHGASLNTPCSLPLPAGEPAQAVLCIHLPSHVGLVHHQPSNSTRHETRTHSINHRSIGPVLPFQLCPTGQVAAPPPHLHPTTAWSWFWVGRTPQTAV
jgi:hypothetical protein